VHAEAHDPNATLLSAISDSDREAKSKGLPKAFLEGRQKSLDQFAPNAPPELKDFLQAKQKGNKEFLEFYAGNPDVRTCDPRKAVRAALHVAELTAGERPTGGVQAGTGAVEVGRDRHPRSDHASDQGQRRPFRFGRQPGRSRL
jgi:hypothetical protein